MRRKFNMAVTLLAVLYPFVGLWWWALVGMSPAIGIAWFFTTIGLLAVAVLCWTTNQSWPPWKAVG